MELNSVMRPLVAALFLAVAGLAVATPANAAPLQSLTAQVHGVTIHYLRGGSGPPVLLIHGYPESSRTWREVGAQLATRYTVIAPDTRGFGDSSMTAPYTSAAIAGDLYGLMRQLGFRRVYVVGHDFGVQAAAAYATLHRSDVRALVVMESPLAGYGLEDFYGKIWHFLFFQSKYPEMLIPGHERTFFRSFAFQDHLWNKTAMSAATIDAYLDDIVRPGRMVVGFAYYRALPADAAFFRANAAPRWTFPVLAIDGDHSLKGATALSFRRVAAHVSSAIAPNCGHFIQEEQPAFLTSRLMRFFSATP